MLKKSTLLSMILFFMISVTVYAIPTESESNSGTSALERVLIEFNSSIDESIIRAMGGQIHHTFSTLPVIAASIPVSKVEKLVEFPNIKTIRKDRVISVQSQIENWGIEAVKAPKAWKSGYTGKGIKIAVIDTGIDSTHPDLDVAGGDCFITDPTLGGCSNSFLDDNGHGTHVAGIIAAKDNNFGAKGVAPDAVIYSLKALNHEGYGNMSDVYAAIEWSIENKMDIINMSLTTPYRDTLLDMILDKAYRSGILIVAAAGNNGTMNTNIDTVEYPGKFDSTIAVSAIDNEGKRVSFSATGNAVEIAAPGNIIYSTFPVVLDGEDGQRDGYALMSGTSMAAPFVTGVLATYKEEFSDKSNSELRQLLQKNAFDIGDSGRDPLYGYGIVQANESLSLDPNVFQFTIKSAKDGKVALQWSKPIDLAENIIAFQLYRDQKLIKTIDKTISSFDDYVLKGRYYYQLRAVTESGQLLPFTSTLRVEMKEPSFNDLYNGDRYTPYIVYLTGEKIVSGYGGELFKPQNKLTRAEAVIMISRAKGLTEVFERKTFADVSSRSVAAGYIQAAYEAGIINGFSSMQFAPEKHITRAEMAIILSKAYVLPDQQIASFSDVVSSMKSYEAINKISAANITIGFKDGTFRPYDDITRADFAVFLARAENGIFR